MQNDFGFDFGVGGVDHEVVVVAARHDIAAITTEDDLELVEDAVVFVGIAKARPEVFVNWDGLHGLSFHVHIPDLYCEVIAREDISTVVGKSYVRDGGDYFGEERAGGGVFFLLEF